MPRGERPYDDKMPYVEIDADSSAVAGSFGGGMGGSALEALIYDEKRKCELRRNRGTHRVLVQS